MTEREPRINLNDSSKRPKYDCDLVDRISALPDSILSLILSILPTKNAVATSILSKRWKFAWVTVHNLDFDCSYRKEQNESEIMKFVGFVNRVLLLNDAGLLNKFSLRCDFGRISSHACSWINTAATTKNVQELSLFHESHDGQFEMPISVFNCSSLRSLELCGDIYVSAAIVVFLPRLETLKLNGVHFQSEEAFEKLISGCPILNSLCLEMYDDNGFTCIISSTSLRRLVIWFDDRCGLKLNSLKLNACSLEFLVVMGEISEIFVQKNLKSLVEADFKINYDEHSNNSIVEALRALDCAKTITLSGDVLGALMHATVSLSTEFERLVELKIETSYWGCSSLQYFIQNTVNLQVLTIDESGSHESEKWNSPVQVPRCFSNSLKTVVVHDYHGYEAERETIRYILKHGSALEVMHVSFDESVNGSAMLKLVKEICEFPKKSPDCQVRFLFLLANITEQEANNS